MMKKSRNDSSEICDYSLKSAFIAVTFITSLYWEPVFLMKLRLTVAFMGGKMPEKKHISKKKLKDFVHGNKLLKR